jgi:hypothetical protein
MGRTPNQAETVTFTVSTTPVVRACLEALVKGGLHGKNVAEAAERLIAAKLLEIEGTANYAKSFAEIRARSMKEP